MRRERGKAVWRQIEETLSREIEAGTPPAGDRLPTEFALAERFAVNRHTVRRALQALEEAGVVRIEQGRGTFVQEAVIDYALGARTRFSENLTRGGLRPGGTLLEAGPVAAPADVARTLELPRGAPVLHLRILGQADGRRISVADDYYPLPRFEGLDVLYRETASVSRAMAGLGVADFRRRTTRVTARMPGRGDARILEQPHNRPVLVTEAVNVDRAGTPVEYGLTRWASDWVQLVVESDG